MDRGTRVVDASTVRIAPSNTDQAAAWDGDEGGYWADHAQRFDDSLARHNVRFMAALELSETTRALDVGCGTGQNTRDVARVARSGSALGVDLSARMIELARRLAAAEELSNATFAQADAQICPFEAGTFDLVLSRTAAMFFGDKAAAFRNLAHALRPNGRLALLVWRSYRRNQWIQESRTALAAGRDLPMPPAEGPSPFSMADPGTVRSLLESAGFGNVEFESVDEPMYFGADADDAFTFQLGLLGWMLNGLDAAGQDRARTALRRTLEAHQTNDGVLFGSSAWLITARRA